MRILLGNIDPQDRGVHEALSKASVICHASSAQELIEGVYAYAPDVLLVMDDMPEVWDALRHITDTLPAPAVLLTRCPSSEKATQDIQGVFAYLPYPVDAEILRANLRLAIRHFAHIQDIVDEIRQLHDAFAMRKLIERAKGSLIQHRHLSEADAYSFLRNESRRLRVPMAEVAQALLAEVPQAGQVKAVSPTAMSGKTPTPQRAAMSRPR